MGEQLIISFEKAISLSHCGKNHRSVLLGNGFSVAGHPQFNYKHLYNRSRFDQRIQIMFCDLDTYDFELVISEFEHMMNSPEKYGRQAVDWSKNSIIKIREEFFYAIMQNHPLKYEVFNGSHGLTMSVRTCSPFISNFSKSFTTNYDLLLYWEIMNQKECNSMQIPSDDGFVYDENAELAWLEPHQHFNSRKQDVFYLHGSLFFTKKNHSLFKEKGSGFLKTILQKSIIDKGHLPLVVLEGNAKAKLKKIIEDTYLRNAYEALNQLTGDLFIFGHSLDLSDLHIANAIIESEVKNIFISVYDNDRIDPPIQERAKLIFKNKNVYFFDANSTQVWQPTNCTKIMSALHS